jgi:hypothetical protein
MQSHRAILGLALLILFSGNWSDTAQGQNAPARTLANGVLKTIPSDLNPRDMFTLPMVLPDLEATKFEPKTIPNQDTLFGQSRRVILFRDSVYQYEISFTGLRQARLKIPIGNGGIATRNIWYMIYRLRDTGETMTFDQVKQNPEFDHLMNELKVGKPLPAGEKKLLLRFTLEGWIPVGENGQYQKVAYRDSIDPIVLAQIRQREDPNQVLLDAHQMSKVEIPLATNAADPGVWGVAIWEDVDPRLDYVSVYVKGLTNAFRLNPDPNAPSKFKTLQLNFWRPGDTVNQETDFIDFGIPLVDDTRRQVLITERYDLPGPVIRGYFVNKDAKREVLVVEADAQVNLKDFKSALTPTLDQGKLPAPIAQAFAASGITVDNGVALTTAIPGRKWSFKQGENEYILALEPQFWEPDFDGIRFIKSLDHLWIYR